MNAAEYQAVRDAQIPLASAIADAEVGHEPPPTRDADRWRRQWDAVYLREMDVLTQEALAGSKS